VLDDDDSSIPPARNPPLSRPAAAVPRRRPIQNPPRGPNPFQEAIDVDNVGVSDNSNPISGWGRRGESTQEQLPRNNSVFHPSAFRDNR
jgi:hypothetical protein